MRAHAAQRRRNRATCRDRSLDETGRLDVLDDVALMGRRDRGPYGAPMGCCIARRDRRAPEDPGVLKVLPGI